LLASKNTKTDMQSRDSREPSARQRTSLWQSLRIQQRVIGALLMREVLTRFGRHNIGFLWLFIEPMIFTVAITVLWTFLRSVTGAGSAIPIVAFAITGYSSVLLWRNMPGHCIGAVEPNRSLLYHRNVKVIDVYLSRLTLEAVGATISFVVLIALAVASGLIPGPEDILKVFAGWAMLAWFGFSLALFLAPLAEKVSLVQKLWGPASYIMFPLSGVAFLVDALPPAAREIVLLFPMVHGLELLRDGYFGSAFNAHYDMFYMTVCCALLTLFGLAQVRDISRKGVLD
jgi:ABC-type polysaccharide/polyol phosphate export permease